MSGPRRFVRGWVGLSLGVVVALQAVGSLTPVYWGVASAFCLLALVALTAPAHVRAPWRRRLRLPLAVAVLLAVLLATADLTAQVGVLFG